MYKLTADKYEHVKYDKETLNLILEILKDEINTYRVLEALVIDKKNNGIGLSRSLMYKTIKVSNSSIKSNDGKVVLETKEMYITRKIADKIIYMLLGAGLICYMMSTKEIYYTLTIRGVQVCLQLKEKNLINVE